MAKSVLGKRKLEANATAAECMVDKFDLNEDNDEPERKRRKLKQKCNSKSLQESKAESELEDDDSDIDFSDSDTNDDNQNDQNSAQMTDNCNSNDKKNNKIQTKLVLSSNGKDKLKEKRIECKICGMLYISHSNEDNSIHLKYHEKIVNQLNIKQKKFDTFLLKFIVWDNDQITKCISKYFNIKIEKSKNDNKKEKENEKKMFSIFAKCKDQNDPEKMKERKLNKKYNEKMQLMSNDCIVKLTFEQFMQIENQFNDNDTIFYACKIMDKELGYFNNSNNNCCIENEQSIYIYLRKNETNMKKTFYNIIGCIVCEPRNHAYLIEINSNECDSNGNDVITHEKLKRKSEIGIVKLWVQCDHRGQGIASLLLNCIVENEKISKNKYISFCQPTRFGRTFAKRYIKNEKFLVY